MLASIMGGGEEAAAVLERLRSTANHEVSLVRARVRVRVRKRVAATPIPSLILFQALTLTLSLPLSLSLTGRPGRGGGAALVVQRAAGGARQS